MPKAATIGVFCVLWAITGTIYAEEGLATYYTKASCIHEGTSGVKTANVEVYDEKAYTCALRSHQFGGLYQVCLSERPDKCVVVRHNDFGPSRRCYHHGTIVDLSPAAFAKLAPLKRGKIKVIIRHVNNDK